MRLIGKARIDCEDDSVLFERIDWSAHEGLGSRLASPSSSRYGPG